MNRINILIPVFNDKTGLKETLESIAYQSFDKKNIYTTIVDFGSTDGSYELALKNPQNTAVYRIPDVFRRTCFEARAVKFWRQMFPSGDYTFQVLLRPGDMMYPEYLKRCSEQLVKHVSANPVFLICEADLKLADGTIKKQTPLYHTTKIIGKEQVKDLLSKGIMHQVSYFGGGISDKMSRIDKLVNERIWWEKVIMTAIDRNVLYIPDQLICVREKRYEDELEAVLIGWEQIINITSRLQSTFCNELDQDTGENGEKSMALYSLWRAMLLCREQKYKDAMDCILIAGVISPEIQNCGLYQMVLTCFNQRDEALLRETEALLNTLEDKTVDEWINLSNKAWKKIQGEK